MRCFIPETFCGCLRDGSYGEYASYKGDEDDILSVASIAYTMRSTNFVAIGPVVDVSLRNTVLMLSSTMMVHHWADRPINRKLENVDSVWVSTQT